MLNRVSRNSWNVNKLLNSLTFIFLSKMIVREHLNIFSKYEIRETNRTKRKNPELEKRQTFGIDNREKRVL